MVLAVALGLTNLHQAHGFAGLEPPDGYEITVKCKPYKNCFIVLGHFFGGEFILDTTAVVNEKSEAVFSGTEKLNGGIYVIFIEGRSEYFDFLISTPYPRFTIISKLNTKDNTLDVDFLDSPENTLLSSYKNYMSSKEREIMEGHTWLASAETHEDSTFAIRRLSDIDREIRKYRSDIIEKHPESFLSTLLRAMQEPLLPEHLKYPSNAADSSAARYYRKEHFWDGVNFWDGRLAFTPFFNDKLDRYFYEVVEWESDSVIQKIDWIMSTAVANAQMEHLILDKLLYGSMHHRFKWESPVFIHLFEKYVAPKQYPWLTPEINARLSEHAYLLMGNTVGAPATDILLPDPNGMNQSLLAVKAKYTVLSFWDPTCSHCVETLPVMDSIFRTEWQPLGVKIFAVAVETEGSRSDWVQIIQANNIEHWTHVYNAPPEATELGGLALSNPCKQYDVWYYPAFFLLDEEKHFVAKKLNFNQLRAFIQSL